MLLDFSELSNHFFSISDIFAVTQVNRGKTRFTMSEPRPTDALLFFASTTGVCYQQNAEPLYIPQRALVYMPKSCRYIWENEAAPNSSMQKNILFEFTLKITESFFEIPIIFSITQKTERFQSGQSRPALGAALTFSDFNRSVFIIIYPQSAF